MPTQHVVGPPRGRSFSPGGAVAPTITQKTPKGLLNPGIRNANVSCKAAG